MIFTKSNILLGSHPAITHAITPPMIQTISSKTTKIIVIIIKHFYIGILDIYP